MSFVADEAHIGDVCTGKISVHFIHLYFFERGYLESMGERKF